MTAVYGLLTSMPIVLTSSCRVIRLCHLDSGAGAAKRRAARGSYAKHGRSARPEIGRIREGRGCPGSGLGALDSPPGPHSPIGRGSGLKIRPVSVRVRLGARRSRWSAPLVAGRDGLESAASPQLVRGDSGGGVEGVRDPPDSEGSRASAMRSEAAALRRDINEANILVDRLQRRYLKAGLT